MIDDEYTLADHEARENDPYAKAKYDLTLRWLRAAQVYGSLVNIGCGGGYFNEMAYTAGFEVVGLEPDLEAHKLAVTTAQGRYRVSNTGLFDFRPEGATRSIVLHDVLEHIESEAAALARVAELMDFDSVAVISVPAMPWLFGYHDRQLGHYRRYTKTSFRCALEPKFEIVKMRYLGMLMIPVALWYSRIRDRAYPIDSVSTGLKARVLAMVCNLESRLPGPAGTSVIALIRLRRPVMNS